MLVSVDACHSGDSSRDINKDCVRGTERVFVIPVDGSLVVKKEKGSGILADVEFVRVINLILNYQMDMEN